MNHNNDNMPMAPSPINPHCGVMTLPQQLPAKLPAVLVALQRTLQRGGWTVETLDLDLHNDTARAEFRRIDGLHVTFDARQGRASITRELVAPIHPDGRRYGGGLRTEFLGRTRIPAGARPGLKLLCSYLADNGTVPMLAREVRDAMRIAMGAPRLLEAAP